MTTENDELVPLPDRSVAELLQLGTYQGMTDSEIQSLINYWMQQSFDSAISSAQISVMTDGMSQMIEGNRRQLESLESMVQSVMSYQPTLGVM